MNVNELRLGNCLFIPGLERTVKVSSIFSTHFRCQSLDGKISHDESIRVNYQPIQLSPEIMKQFGFETDNDEIFVKNKVLYWIKPSTIQIAMGYTPLMNIRCEYVHQLQNLLFVLTGKEIYYAP